MQELWQKFSLWVTLEWSNLTFIAVITVFAVLGLMAVLSFFKKSVNKDKKPKWGPIVLCAISFIIVAVLCAARFA